MEAGPFLVLKTVEPWNLQSYMAYSKQSRMFVVLLTEVILLQGSWYFYINKLKARTTVGIDTFKFSDQISRSVVSDSL